MRNPTLAHPPCFDLVFSPTYSSLCLLFFGKWLLLSWVTGHNQAKHMSLKARRATLMVMLEQKEESRCSSLLRQCPAQGKPQSSLSSIGTSIFQQQHSFCPIIIPLFYLLKTWWPSVVQLQCTGILSAWVCSPLRHPLCLRLLTHVALTTHPCFKISVYSYNDNRIPLIPL